MKKKKQIKSSRSFRKRSTPKRSARPRKRKMKKKDHGTRQPRLAARVNFASRRRRARSAAAPCGNTEKGDQHVAAHSDDCSDSGALRQSADLAAQQGMGILPERRNRPGAGDPLNTVSDGPFVAALVLTGAARERHGQAHLRGIHGRRDHFGGQRIEYEVISRTRFQQFREPRLCVVQTLNSFNPNRPGFRKFPKDIVGPVHIPPSPVQDTLPQGGFQVGKWSAIGRPMLLGFEDVSNSKQGGYGYVRNAAGEPAGGYVNSGDVRYIFRDRGPAPGIRALNGGNVVRHKGRLAAPSADRSEPNCSLAMIG